MHIFLTPSSSLFSRDRYQHWKSQTLCSLPHLYPWQLNMAGGKHTILTGLTLNSWPSLKETWYCLAILPHVSNPLHLLHSKASMSYLFFSPSSTFPTSIFFLFHSGHGNDHPRKLPHVPTFTNQSASEYPLVPIKEPSMFLSKAIITICPINPSPLAYSTPTWWFPTLFSIFISAFKLAIINAYLLN